MLDNPLVSVVIPMYNSGSYIEDTLQSVLRQSYESIEVIVVDDGSTDLGAQIVKKLQDKHSKIKYIYQENSGVSAARNTGIEHSNGKYIAFLDSDDFWLEDKIEKQMQELQNKGCNACYCGYTEYIDGEMKKKFPDRFYEGDIFFAVLEGRTSAWTGTWLISKDVITQSNISFTEGCKWAEDMEFFLKIASAVKVCAVWEYLAVYRKRGNSTANFSLLLPENRITEIEMWLRLSSWILNESSDLNYSDKIKAVCVIRAYRIPSAAIQFLFRGMVLGMDMSSYMKQYELKEHMKNFKPQITIECLKLIIQKTAIQNRIILKLISGICRKIFLLKIVMGKTEKPYRFGV